MAVLKNRAKMSTSTTGTGTITLGSAESGYQTFADAGLANADVVRYVIEDTGGAFEIGTGTYTSSGTTLTRTVSESSNSDAAINLSGSATVFIGATAEDILSDVVDDTTPQLGGNLDVQAREITTSTTNGNVKLTPNGTGVVEVKGAGGNDGTLQLNCSANSHGVKIKSPPHSAAASYTLTLPDDDGGASEFLQTDGSGNLSWATAGGGGADLYTANESSPTAQPSATGANAIAIGDSAVASGLRSTAIGKARATGTDTFAVNISTNSNYGAQGTGSTAIGTNAHALGSNSLAFGQGSYTGNSQATAIGAGTYATGISSLALAVNYNSSYGALATSAVAIGNKAKASATQSIAIGNDALSTTANLIALGGTADTVKISGAYTLPTSDGTNGQVLTTDGSGAVTFADAGGGGGGADLYAANESSPTAQPSATGTNSIGIGDSAVSSGARSVALSNSRASGDDSFAAAMMSNSSSYGAQGTNSIAIGQNAKAHGYGGVALGFNATAGNGNRGYAIGAYSQATNNYSLAFGNTAVATGYGAIAFGYSTSDADYAVTIGQKAQANGIKGAIVFSNGSIQSGNTDSQTGIYLLKGSTTDATPLVLTTNDTSAGSDDQLILVNNSAYAFHGTIVARQSASQGTACAAWKVEGLIRREANAGTTVLVNSATTVIDNTPNWGMALSADTTNGCLKVQVTGAASTNINYVATIHTSETYYT